MLNTSLASLCLLLALAVAPSTAAQVDIDLSEVAAGRGRITRGVGGQSGFPQAPVAGRLGASTTLVDLNGDGFDELVVAAPALPSNPMSQGTSLDNAGSVYIVFGSADAGLPTVVADIDLGAPVGATVVELRGEPGERLGASVAAAGDVDMDGMLDLVIGAPGRQRPGFGQAGAAYVIFGDPNLDSVLSSGATAAAHVIGTRAVRLLATDADGRAGTAVGGGVDMDADSRSELILGAPLASSAGRLQNGTAWVVYGDASLRPQTEVDLGALGAGEVTRITGATDFELLGQSVVGLGRFDSVRASGGTHPTDGDDIALGAPGLSTNGFFSGGVFVLRGDDAAAPAAAYTTADFGAGGSAGLLFEGAASGDQLGLFVGSAGDFVATGDGFVELLAAAPFAAGVGSSDAGAMYLIAGQLGGGDPLSLDMGDLSAGSSLAALAIFGAQNGAGINGLSAAPFGDYDADGGIELAVGFPGFDRPFGGLQTDAGVVEILDGNLLQPPAAQVIDLQLDSSAVVARMLGEINDAEVGAALFAGDHDGDAEIDLAIGAPGAPADASDPELRATGRGHLVFGPLARVGGLDPVASFFGGPTVAIDIFDLPPGPVSVDVGGVNATILNITTGDLGRVEFEVPMPIVPGSTVDIEVSSPLGLATLPNAFSFQAFTLTGPPSPDLVVPDVTVDLTAQAVAPLGFVSVTVGGQSATVESADPVSGSIRFVAPGGLAASPGYDVVVSTPNGDDTLVASLEYAPFALLSVTPDSGSQESGISIPEGTPGFPETGVQPVEIVLDVPVTGAPELSGAATVEFGSVSLGFREGEVLDIDGSSVTVVVPEFLLGPQAVPVDLRITDGADVVVFEDAFTYEPSDYRLILDPVVEAPGLGANPPEMRLSGGFVPGGKQLVLLRELAPETNFVAIFIGVAEPAMPIPFKGGLLGVQFFPNAILGFPLGGPPEVALKGSLDGGFGPAGVKIYMQLVTRENAGMIEAFGFSQVLEATLRVP